MVDMSGGTPLGVAEVEVRADLNKLLGGFQKAKAETRGFERDMQGVRRETELTAAAEAKMDRELRQLARAYDPVHAAMLRYQTDIRTINRLQAAGIVDPLGGARLRQGALNALNQAKTGIQGVGAAAGVARGLVAGFGISMGVQLVGQLASATVASLKATASIKDQAAALGLTTDELQEYRLAAVDMDLTQEDMDGAFKEFNQTVRQAAAGLERPAKLFKLLGININDANGQIRPINDLFLETIDRLGQVGNQAERAAGQAVAFGEQYGPKMGEAVRLGADGIRDLREGVRELGGILSEEEIQRADETAKKLEKINQALSAKFASVVVDNAKAIGLMAEGLAALAEAALAVPAALTGTADHVSALTVAILNIIPGLGTFVALMTELRNLTNGGAVRGFNVPGRSVTVPLGTTQKAPTKPSGYGQGGGGGTAGGISLANLLAPKPPKGRKGGGGAAVENKFDEDLMREQERQLRLERERTGNLTRRNEIDHQLIDNDLAERIEAINAEVRRKALTAKQAERLKAEAEVTAAAQKEAADREMRLELIEQSHRYAQEFLDLEQESLDIELRLARTDDERRRLELLILSSKQQQARDEIEKQIAIAQEKDDQSRVTELVEERRKLLENQNREIEAFDIEHLTGLEKFKNDLPKTVKEINQAIRDIRFDRLTQKLQEAAQMATDIGDAFGQFAGDIASLKNPWKAFQNLIANLAQTMTENVIVKPVSEWATKAIGVPLAKRTFGKELTGPDALTVQQMNMALALSTQNLGYLTQAAAMAAANLNAVGTANAAGIPNPLAIGGPVHGEGALGDGLGMTGTVEFDAVDETIAQGLDPLTQASGQLTQAMSAQIPILGQFGGGLMQILSSLAGAGGGGGGGGFLGFLKMGLSIAGAAFGGGIPGSLGTSIPAAPSWLGGFDTMPLSLGSGLGVTGTIGFDTGGFTGSGGDNDVAGLVHKNEFVWDADTTRRFMPVLDMIHRGRLPSFAPMGLGEKMDRASRPNQTFKLGDTHLHGVRDERQARRSASQYTAGVQRDLARITKSGLATGRS